MNPIYTMKGPKDILEVFEHKLTIAPAGALGFLSKGVKGKKEIPFTSIVAIQFKEANFVTSGYLQFTIPGGNESKGGVFAAAQDENTFMFAKKKDNAIALEIKNYIESEVHEARKPQTVAPTANLSDELQKLATLKEQGILSDGEFQSAKQKLLNS